MYVPLLCLGLAWQVVALVYVSLLQGIGKVNDHLRMFLIRGIYSIVTSPHSPILAGVVFFSGSACGGGALAGGNLTGSFFFLLFSSFCQGASVLSPSSCSN